MWVLGQGGGPGPQVSEAALHGAPNEPRVGGGLTSRVPPVRVAFPTAHLGSGGRDDVAGSLSTWGHGLPAGLRTATVHCPGGQWHGGRPPARRALEAGGERASPQLAAWLGRDSAMPVATAPVRRPAWVQCPPPWTLSLGPRSCCGSRPRTGSQRTDPRAAVEASSPPRCRPGPAGGDCSAPGCAGRGERGGWGRTHPPRGVGGGQRGLQLGAQKPC